MDSASGPPEARRARLLSPLVAVPVMLVLLWGHLAPTLAKVYTPDSYAYASLGEGLIRHGTYATSAVRDLHGPHVLPQPGRSFPPLWPTVVGVAGVITGAGVNAGAYANAVLLAATLLAAWLLGRRFGPHAGWLVIAVFGLFFLHDAGYRGEAAAARSLPLALLLHLTLLVVLVPWLSSTPVSRSRAACTGVLLAASSLTRFDQFGFALLMLGALCLLPRVAGRAAKLSLCAAFVVAWLPWGVRNLTVYGMPFASDNTASALAAAPGQMGMSYFAPGATPATLFTAPGAWLDLRWHQLLGDLGIIGTHAPWALIAAAVLLVMAWRRLTRADRLLLGALALHAAATTLVVATTSFTDERYFTPIILDVFLAGALGWWRLLESRVVLRRAVSAGVWCAVMMVAGPTAWASLHARADGSCAMLPPTPTAVAYYAGVGARLRAIAGDTALIGTRPADALSYHTGLHSIYVPLNIVARGADFDAWLVDWHPDHLWVATDFMTRLGLDDWRCEPRSSDDDMVLLKSHLPDDVPPPGPLRVAASLTLNERGVAVMGANHLLAALGLFAEALRLDPLNHQALTNRGIARAAQHDLPAARAAHDEAVSVAPLAASPRYWRGRFFAEHGDLLHAIPDFEAAVKLSDGATRESAALGVCLDEAGRSAEAQALAERIRAAGHGAAWERERAAFVTAVFPLKSP